MRGEEKRYEIGRASAQPDKRVAPKTGARYDWEVRVIARKTLIDYVNNKVDSRLRKTVKSQLDAWFAETRAANWSSPAELKQHYRSASIISTERVVFNIKGNEFRLIVAIEYSAKVVLVVWIGTHKEYDQIEAATVKYDKTRYTK